MAYPSYDYDHLIGLIAIAMGQMKPCRHILVHASYLRVRPTERRVQKMVTSLSLLGMPISLISSVIRVRAPPGGALKGSGLVAITFPFY